MASTRHLLLFALLSGSIACSEKPKPDPSAVPQPDPGSLARPVEAPSEKPRAIDRSPIPIKESPTKMSLSATKLDEELLDERTRYYLEDRVLRLHPLRDRMLVSYAGFVAVLKDNRLELGSDLWPQEAYDFTVILGTWPNVIARVYFDSWRSPGYQRQAPIKETRAYWWNISGWEPLGHDMETKGAGWRDGSFFTLDGALVSLTVAKAPKGGSLKLAVPKRAAPRDSARCKDIPTEIVAEELDALPSGEAFVFGKHCGGGGYAMERWAADQAESVIDDLPDAPAAAKRSFISAGAPDRAHVVLSTGEEVYAARWEGQAFRKIELKDKGDVRATWTAADGALFFVLESKAPNAKKGTAELVRVLPSGEVSRSAAFALSPSVRVWAADAQTAYVSTFGSILSTKPGLVFIKEKEEDPKAPAPARSATALPQFTDGCPTPFVFLYDVSSKSPPAFDFPGTRKALSTFARVSDIGFIEFVHEAQRKLGVKVPSAEIGREVVAHVVANMKDEHPELVCFDPKESVRSIKIQ
jgi:hypothetical protein